MLTIVGGTYLEFCENPHWYQLYGSGLRAAVALSSFIPDMNFTSCVGSDYYDTAMVICDTFGIKAKFKRTEKTIHFSYFYPLATPYVNLSENDKKIAVEEVKAEKILYYGFAEADCTVRGDYVVYDPQNWIPFSKTGSTAKHLAIVLNLKEAILLSGLSPESGIQTIGREILLKESAEAVVIKNGALGATVIDLNGEYFVPLYETESVFSIGSGDIFSAVFAYYWATQKKTATESANFASQYTATYCSTRILPLPQNPDLKIVRTPPLSRRKIYLAGPFFSLSDRWFINEARKRLSQFGNEVFSPLHNVGWGSGKQVVDADLQGIKDAEVIFAILNGNDPGTIFEIGYAVSLGKRVVILAESSHDLNMTMFEGSGCEITNDFTTAIYKSSW